MSETNKGLLINRKDCYHYRDLYFDCLEKNNENKNRCHREFEKFSDVCQSTWVSHFIRKRGVEKYKKTVEPKQDGKSDTNVTNALNYCYTIFSTNFVINSRTLMLAAKIVAMCHTTKTTISSIDSNKLNLILNKIQKELPNCENSIKLTIQLLLDASKGDWSKINILEQIPDKTECFAILAKEFNNTNQCKELLQLFMDQIVSIGKTITSEEFKYIQTAMSYYKEWKVEEAIISKETLECSICKEKLPEQKPLDNEQFLKLRDAFREHLEDGLSNRISGENTGKGALYLGPNTHLLSNDNFVDHIGSNHFLPEIAPLFKIWRETRCISFIPEETDFIYALFDFAETNNSNTNLSDAALRSLVSLGVKKPKMFINAVHTFLLDNGKK
uniref:Uncharacterized protein n=1 Tax=Meloidogyne javanica TaxID=6303 RepID=A0A915MIA4_MELJA